MWTTVAKLLLALVGAVTGLVSLYKKWRETKEVREEVQGEIAVQEAEIKDAVIEVMAEPRDHTATDKRMRDGSF